ncbi:MAG: VCBS repeat-containing protein [Clostridiales bacterium]|nr:VCBS repeat-containing protein [Clostridiales bacterium]MCF8021263.1 VCBS repeat-containing protein [Clostridiales bacterium]
MEATPYNVKFLDYKQADVNGDNIIDSIYLIGNIPYPDSPFVENITLIIQNNKTCKPYRIALETNAGYNPTLFTGDFNKDSISDILISIDSGGSGAIGFYYVYSFINNQPQKLFDYEDFNEKYRYKVLYRDNYKVQVISSQLNKIYTIDITYKGQEYLSEIYDQNGILVEPIQGWVNPLSGLYPIDVDRNGTYELYALQRIAGRYNADSLGYVQTTLTWNGLVFKPLYQFVGINGADIS